MRIAVVSDIHGNRAAFDAVLADLRHISPDLILHGGDLADSGSSPVYIVDRIRELGWQGVVGNTDEMLFRPEALREFASPSPHLAPLFAVIEAMARASREALGGERLAWLSELPRAQSHGEMALVHASPATAWTAPSADAGDAELDSVFRPLGCAVAVHAHIHRPYVRALPNFLVANTGSVGLAHDGDPRAAYLLVDGARAAVRRVEYDIGAESKALRASGLPHADWIARMLLTGRFEMP